MLTRAGRCKLAFSSSGYPLLNLDGMLGSNFVVQYSTNLAGSNWLNLLSLTNLPSSPYLFLEFRRSRPARANFLAPCNLFNPFNPFNPFTLLTPLVAASPRCVYLWLLTTRRIAASSRSKDSIILNCTRARSALWPGRCTL